MTRKGALVEPKAPSAAGGVGVLGRVPSGHRRGRVGACGARECIFFVSCIHLEGYNTPTLLYYVECTRGCPWE